MGMFHDLMNNIFKHASAGNPGAQTPAAPAASTPAAPTPGPSSQTSPEPAAAGSGETAPGTTSAQNPAPAPAVPASVDVGAVLDDLAAKNPEQLDWKRSIVDLLKLVGMDSSLGARKKLAAELHYPGDTNDSAQMNVWLHKEVLKQLAQNGGKLPPGLLDY
ncbi:MAG: DUF3597 domain-containing protein [Verrucomicrobia bacterium]|nr:DUF3597 domain-containing protein [Verrucomicrobiota bacterium]